MSDDQPGQSPGTGLPGRLPFNKVCELEDFADPELAAVLRDVCAYKLSALPPSFPSGAEHRKDWEVAMAIRSLGEFGAVCPDSVILGVAAGSEDTIFHLTSRVAQVFATDKYLDPGPWQALAPLAMMMEPAVLAPSSFDENRLVVQHMDGRSLRYPDASFDGIFSSGSIEHFGQLEDIAAAAYEMGRVLKSGGVLAVSTEYCFSGPPGGRGWPGGLTLLLSREDLERYVIDASGLEPVDDLRTDVSVATQSTAQNLAQALGDHMSHVGRRLERSNPKGWTAWRFPHVVFEQEGYVLGSVHLTLRKTDRYPLVPNAWAKPAEAIVESISHANRVLLEAAMVVADQAASGAPSAGT